MTQRSAFSVLGALCWILALIPALPVWLLGDLDAFRYFAAGAWFGSLFFVGLMAWHQRWLWSCEDDWSREDD